MLFPFMPHTFAISIVRLTPSLMLFQDNEVPFDALNLQSPNEQNKQEKVSLKRLQH